MPNYQDPMQQIEKASVNKIEKDKNIAARMRANRNMLIYLAAFIVLIVTLGLHSYPKYQELIETRAQIVTTEGEIQQLKTNIESARRDLSTLEVTLEGLRKERGPLVDAVFPVNENIEDLTRFLEAYSVGLQKFGTMELNTISFKPPTFTENYGVTEINMAIQCNQVNLVKFMQMLNDSGSLNEANFFNNRPVRLMRIENIDVTIPDRDALSSDALYSADLRVSAFFQMTAEQKEAWREKNKKRR